MRVVKDELLEVRAEFADERRTHIVDAGASLSIKDLVPEEDQIVTISHLGYIKRVKPDEWRMQHRGGMGKKGMTTRAEDFVTSIFVANTHSVLMVFTSQGKVYPLNVYEVPQTSRTSRGRPIINLVPVQKNERIAAVVSVREIGDSDERDLLFVSREGLVKRTEDDEVSVVRLMNPEDEVDVLILTAGGQCIRFRKSGPKGAPVFGRTARGNKGVKLRAGDTVVDALLLPASAVEDSEEDSDTSVDASGDEALDGSVDLSGDGDDLDSGEDMLLTVTALGYGKRTPFEKYPVQGRNGKGVISHKTGEDVGEIVGALVVQADDQLMIVTDTGRVIRISAASIRVVKSRSSKGVRLMRLEPGECIVDIARIAEADEEESEEIEGEAGEAVDAPAGGDEDTQETEGDTDSPEDPETE